MKNPVKKIRSAFMDDPEFLAMLGIDKGDKGDRGETGQGEKGDKPVKYVDYFTYEEIEQIAQYVLGLVLEQVRLVKGIDYFDGKDGRDGVDGHTPVKGQDYFTEREIEAFLKKVTPKKGVDYYLPDTAEEIIAKLNSIPGGIDPEAIKDWLSPARLTEMVVKKLKKEKVLEMRDIKNMPLNLFDLLHGGGPTLVAGSGVTLTFDINTGKTTISASASGSSTTETPSGTIDGVNKTFTLAHTPTSGFLLFLNGQYQAGGGVDYTLSGSTITYVTAPDAGFSGLPFVAQYNY